MTGKAIPLFIAKKSDMFLPGFAWYEDIRPKDKEDIFNITEGMIKLM